MHIKRGTVRERRPVVARFAIKNPRRNTIAAIKDLLLVSKMVVIQKKRHKSNSLKACICHLHFGSLYRHRVYSCLTIFCLNIPFQITFKFHGSLCLPVQRMLISLNLLSKYLSLPFYLICG